MLFQTYLILMCLCMLVGFSNGFVVRHSPVQLNRNQVTQAQTKAQSDSKQLVLKALVGPDDKYFELASTLATGFSNAATQAGYFGIAVIALLAAALALLGFSVIQSSVGMSAMRAEMRADKKETQERMDMAAADTTIKFRITSAISLFSLVVAVIALNPHV